jgi:acetamidase/formamidase
VIASLTDGQQSLGRSLARGADRRARPYRMKEPPVDVGGQFDTEGVIDQARIYLPVFGDPAE